MFKFARRTTVISWLCIALACQATTLYSQDLDSIDERIIQIFDENNQLVDNTIEELSTYNRELHAKKISLNSAAFEDIQAFPFLTDFQVKSLWQYLVDHRPLLSIHELTAVPGFATSDVELLSKYVETGERKTSLRQKVRGVFWVKEQWGEARQDDSVLHNAAYEGDDTRIVSRLDCSVGSIFSIKTCVEKDPGESLAKGFDFYSGSIMATPRKHVRKIIVGDFSARFGQGIVLWSGSGSFQSSLTALRKRPQGVTPYAGIDENCFLRGIALDAGSQRLRVAAFFSCHEIDGNLADSTGTAISGFSTSGYHRTRSELANRHSVEHRSFGVNSSSSFKYLKIGLSGVVHQFDKEIIPALADRNLYSLRGKQNVVVGSDIFLNFKRVDIFAECGIDNSKHCAIIVGSEAVVADNVGFSLLLRDYSPGYNSFISAAYSQAGKTGNERGLLSSLEVKPDSALVLRSSFDYFQHPWVKYGVYSPSDGYELACSGSYQAADSQKITVSLKYSASMHNQANQDSGVIHVEDICKTQAKMQYLVQVLERWVFKSTAAYSRARGTATPGIAVAQDVEYAIPDRMSVAVWYCLFDGTYENRLYVYEPDVRTGSSMMLYEEGTKFHLKATVKLLRRVTLAAKYARLNKATRYSCTRDEVSAFLKYNF